jgi:hypothetical protein
MIIDNLVTNKAYDEKILNFYGFWNYQAPCCQGKNCLIRHASYDRYLFIFEDGIFKEEHRKILRLLCKSCQKTHAILPAGTIPYRYYTFSCIFEMLSRFFLKKESASKISQESKIPSPSIYFFVAKFIAEMISCIHFLKMYLTASQMTYADSPALVMGVIYDHFSPLTFFKIYFRFSGQIFLMSRRRFILSKILAISL